MNLMSMTAKAMHMAVAISIASHLRCLIFFSTGFFAMDVASLSEIVFPLEVDPIIALFHLHALFLMVTAA